MKHSYMVFAALVSFLGLNAMEDGFKVDTKTLYRTDYRTECYKRAMQSDDKMDRHRKRCKEDLNKSMMYMTMNCVPLLSKDIRQSKTLFPIISFLAVAQGYFLYDKFMTYRLAQKGIIDYRS